MSQINFLPESFNKARRRKQRRPMEFAVIVATAVALASAWHFSSGPNNALAGQSESLDRSIEQVQQLQDEQARLEQERSALQRRLQVARETYQPITVTQVLARLSEQMPESMRFVDFELSTVRPEPERLPDPNRPQTRVITTPGTTNAQPPMQPHLMRMTIRGLSPSDDELVTFIRRLDRDPVFSSVALRNSRQGETDTHLVREFQMDLVIDLDRRFIDPDTQGGGRDED